MVQNSKAYPREENNLGDDSIMSLPYEGNLCDTIIVGNTDLSSNSIRESRYLVLSYIIILIILDWSPCLDVVRILGGWCYTPCIEAKETLDSVLIWSLLVKHNLGASHCHLMI